MGTESTITSHFNVNHFKWERRVSGAATACVGDMSDSMRVSNHHTAVEDILSLTWRRTDSASNGLSNSIKNFSSGWLAEFQKCAHGSQSWAKGLGRRWGGWVGELSTKCSLLIDRRAHANEHMSGFNAFFLYLHVSFLQNFRCLFIWLTLRNIGLKLEQVRLASSTFATARFGFISVL